MESPGAAVWLDAGPGTLANLQESSSLDEIDAVVITHAHPDHWLEMPIVANALLWYEKRTPLPVYSNAHTAAAARDLIGEDIDAAFDWQIIDADSTVTIGDQQWTFAEAEHYVPTLATRVDCGGESIVFTSDTGVGFSLQPMVERSGPIDLAIIESTFLNRSEHVGVLHLAADEAGALAEAATVTKVLLTHQAPREDRQAHLSKAAAKFSGEIVLAEVGQQYPASS